MICEWNQFRERARNWSGLCVSVCQAVLCCVAVSISMGLFVTLEEDMGHPRLLPFSVVLAWMIWKWNQRARDWSGLCVSVCQAVLCCVAVSISMGLVVALEEDMVHPLHCVHALTESLFGI
jgi:putative effector of murein hydrolase